MAVVRPVAAVTGANGYLGSRICATLESKGWTVVRLARSPSPGDSLSRRYDLATPVDNDVLRSVDLLVHAAYDFSLTSRAHIWRVNVEGTRRLLRTACDSKVGRILVLSTMSAYAGTTQLYGQAKLAIEAETTAAGGCVIRPGLVYGERAAGMAGALQKITRLPIVPLVAGNSRQYPVHVEDLMTAIAKLAAAETLPAGPIGVANPTPVTFRNLLVALAAQEGRRCHFVQVRWQLVYWALRVGEIMPIALPFRSDSLLGLVHSAPNVPGVEELERLGVTLRAFETDPARIA